MKKARLETLSPNARLRVLRYMRGRGREANMYDHYAEKRRQALAAYVKCREADTAPETDWMGDIFDTADINLGFSVMIQKMALSHLREMPKPVLP